MKKSLSIMLIIVPAALIARSLAFAGIGLGALGIAVGAAAMVAGRKR